jgi:hypothetical protein
MTQSARRLTNALPLHLGSPCRNSTHHSEFWRYRIFSCKVVSHAHSLMASEKRGRRSDPKLAGPVWTEGDTQYVPNPCGGDRKARKRGAGYPWRDRPRRFLRTRSSALGARVHVVTITRSECGDCHRAATMQQNCSRSSVGLCFLQ